jgi:hypothetical protein
MAPPESQVGGVRPANTIPAHLAELAGFGLLLGLAAAIFCGRKGLPLVFLAPTLIILLDLDHLPIYLGIAQPIRPAHSIVFVVTALALTAIVIKRLEIDLVVVSATLGHLGVDTGLFPPFSPFSFVYIQLDPYKAPLLIGAISAAIAAGVVLRQRSKSIRRSA